MDMHDIAMEAVEVAARSHVDSAGMVTDLNEVVTGMLQEFEWDAPMVLAAAARVREGFAANRGEDEPDYTTGVDAIVAEVKRRQERMAAA